MNTRWLACLLVGSTPLAWPVGTAAELGDPAPALEIAEWVKGTPVRLADGRGKHVFVIEFWATWCPPCRASIPHLTELQAKFKDRQVVVVGISDEAPAVVKPFVAKLAESMNYSVAIDQDRQTARRYLEAFGVGGIPHAFVVDTQGRIVWQGHPMAELEETLTEVVAGRYDLARARKRAAGQKLLEEFLALAADDAQSARLEELGQQLDALDREVGGLIRGQPFQAEQVRRQAKFNRALGEYQRAIFSEAAPADLPQLEQRAEALAPPGLDFNAVKQDLRAQAVFLKYYRAVGPEPDAARAAVLRGELEAVADRNPMLLNEMAWRILTDAQVKHRDVDLAIRLAKAAVDASQSQDPNILDTYARALFDGGKIAEAIRRQEQALQLAADQDMREQLSANLKRYKEQAATQ
ncbi:MAG: TlpA family protein disulfide reductase [Verrucomicrobia bacterium]|nr:TlpA family protein disulfide reductase [Verrucomicrobiota bacterium]